MRAALLRRLRYRLGRRGAFLLVAGTGKTSWGISFLVNPPNIEGVQLLDWCGLRQWSWLWIICGLVTLTSAFFRVGRDKVGFIAALIPPIVWATAYAAAAVSGTYSRGVFVAIWYLTSHVGIILWAATVPEHSVPHPRRARKGAGP
ncbi:hypothetical protein ACFY40_11705 [Streptomyces sp. NPDC012950]|uniref:hypothetical protein n=1 Tax=Streptomyces sp. NPDC012950 TaxID=3364858 RepID=UPI0036CFFABA